MLQLKSDVLPSRTMKGADGKPVQVRLQPEILLAVIIIQEVYRENNVKDMMVTSICDGEHMAGSFHYKGLAVDIRTKGTGISRRLFEGVRKALPANLYDVILEDKDGLNEHLHVEYDPK